MIEYDESADALDCEPIEQGNEEVRPQSNRWVTSPAAEWLNSLCPRVDASLPRLNGLNDGQYKEAQELFKYAWHALYYQIENMRFDAVTALTDYEHKAWLTILRKTVGYKKLAEKIPRRVFTKGENRLSNYGVIALPPCGFDDRALTKALSGLERKGWLARYSSDPHPTYGESTIYLPFASRWLMHGFLNDHARRATRRGNRSWDQRANSTYILNMYITATTERCPEFVELPPEGYAAEPVLTGPRKRPR